VAGSVGHLKSVGRVARALRQLGLRPILVGGMAMVVLGSRRVTRDFDFVIPVPADRLDALVDIFYGQGLELVSKVSETGDVVSTIDNRKVATVRLKLDRPSSTYFFNVKTGLRIDLLFDFPIKADTLASRATRIKLGGETIDIASEADLLELKQIARRARLVSGDAEDLAFLEARRRAAAGNESDSEHR
jgi:hypothetical protein